MSDLHGYDLDLSNTFATVLYIVFMIFVVMRLFAIVFRILSWLAPLVAAVVALHWLQVMHGAGP